MDKHVPNLELCKKLKELGFIQETEFYYDRELLLWAKEDYIDSTGSFHIEQTLCPAPLATELLEELPREFSKGMNYMAQERVYKRHITIHPDNSCYIWYETSKPDDSLSFKDSLPNALAKMWIYLEEEKLI